MNASKLAATAIVVLAVAACSGGGSAGAPTGAAGPTAAPGATTSAPGAATTPGAEPTEAPSQDLAAIAAQMCGLLTPADLKTATGAVYGPGVPDAFGNCAWVTTESGGGHVFASVQDAALADRAAAFPGGTQLTVAGHPAYWLPTGSLDTMFVDVGGKLLLLSMSPDNLENQPIVTKLAEVAAGHM